jgi:hypothetical protein
MRSSIPSTVERYCYLSTVLTSQVTPKTESALLYADGSVDIVEKLPDFQLRWKRNDGVVVKDVSYFRRGERVPSRYASRR